MKLDQIYNEDCLVGMQRIPDSSVDMILCDLPYGTTACKWDSVIPLDPLWAQYKRLVKKNAAIVLTASQPFTTTLISSNLAMFKYCWVWEKTRPGDIFNAKNKPLKYHEDICVFSSGTTANRSENRMPYYPQGLKAGGTTAGAQPAKGRVYAFKGARPSHASVYRTAASNYPGSVLRIPNANSGSLHPTQKPVALFEYLIRTYSNEGETVLDNCMGSGTTAIACMNTNRHYIGFEKEETYFDVAQQRITAHAPQMQLIA